ncbi:MAG: sugar transferase [bacterium]|nr:sugar transferase [bacterium]
MSEIAENITENIALKIVVKIVGKFDLRDLLATLLQTRNYQGTEVARRIFDISVALVLLIVTMPLMLVAALVVRLTSPGSVIFSQNRLTKGGQVFRMYKIRTMRADAEAGSGAVLAQKADSRVTPVGRFLRSTRIDELPQLFNILRGEMSLIGPRPERPEIAEKLSRQFANFDRRLEVKAGLTGFAQVQSGYASSVEEYDKKLKLDIYYVDNRSLKLDLLIAMKTCSVVVSGAGAR